MSTAVTTVTGLTILNPAVLSAVDEDLWGYILNDNMTNLGAYLLAPWLEEYNAGNKSGAATLDYANGPLQRATATGNITSMTISNFTVGGTLELVLTQDGTGSRLWSATGFLTQATITLTTTATTGVDILIFKKRTAGTFLSLAADWA